MENDKNKSSIFWILILVLLVLIIAGLTYYFYAKSKSSSIVPDSTQKETNTNTSSQNNVNSSNTNLEKNTGCASELTSSDAAEIQLWKTYTNSKYNFSFKYPETWGINSDEEDRVVLSSESEKIYFQFSSAEMTALDLLGYKSTSSKDVEIACVKTTASYMSGDSEFDPSMDENKRVIVTQFTKENIPHLLMLNYEYLGASISGDIVDAWDLILKTVEFK